MREYRQETRVVATLEGTVFGKLMVKKLLGVHKGKRWWLCLCECGLETEVSTGSLVTGNTISCGCSRLGIHTKHGMARTPTYRIWCSMRHRCSNPNHKDYPAYGGRGIRVCDEWQKFENFYADMGDKPSGLSLDRVDNDLGYEASNCVWATPIAQGNNRRNTVRYLLDGKPVTIRDMSDISGFPYMMIYYRLRAGLTPEMAITTLIKANQGRHKC